MARRVPFPVFGVRINFLLFQQSSKCCRSYESKEKHFGKTVRVIFDDLEPFIGQL